VTAQLFGTDDQPGIKVPKAGGVIGIIRPAGDFNGIAFLKFHPIGFHVGHLLKRAPRIRHAPIRISLPRQGEAQKKAGRLVAAGL
jgi:hypothetical protein